jgi:hypothetical protein
MIGHMRERHRRTPGQGNASLLKAPNSPLVERIDDPDLTWVNRARQTCMAGLNYGRINMKSVSGLQFSATTQFGLHVGKSPALEINGVLRFGWLTSEKLGQEDQR